MITAQVFGTEELIAKFKAAEAAIPGLKPYHLRRCGDIIQENIQMSISSQLEMRTGALWDSVRVFGETKNAIKVGTGHGIDYVQPLEFGSMPHRITAGFDTQAVFGGDVGHYRFVSTGGANMLHFVDREGNERFAKFVNHPGNRPYRFVYKGAMASWIPISFEALRYLREVFEVPL